VITQLRRSRRALQVALIVVIFAFVGTSVVVLGTGTGGGPVDAVARVNGESITLERYNRRYQEYVNAYEQVMQGRLTREMAEQLGLGRQVVDDLVAETLVVQRARAEGLATSDEELNVQIQAIPAFHEDGRFSLSRYEEVLRRLGYSKGGFENDVRRRLTRLKVQGLVQGGVKVTDAEIEQAFVERGEEVRVTWALVELVPLMAEVTPTDAELQAYLEAHAGQFREPERRRIQYVSFAPTDFVRPVPEAEVRKYYEAHAMEFETPEQAQVSHVLVRISDTGGSAAEDEAEAKIADVIRRARAGEDFARLAREVSEDPGTKPRGGELGWVARGEMVPQFEEAVFALKAGEISPEPVRTPFGFHAVKVHAVREGGRQPLREVASQIRERVQAEAAERAARARAEEVRPKLVAAGDFLAEAKALGLAPVEATVPRRGPEASPFGATDPMEEAVFTLAMGGVSLPVETPRGWMVIRAVESLPPGVPPLAEIKDRVTEAFKRERAEAAALERAMRIVAEADAGDFTTVARAAGARVGEAVRFSRARPAERLPGDAMLAALRTPAGRLTEAVKTAEGYYVLKVLERTRPALDGLPAEREEVAREVLGRKQSQAWEAWLAAIRAGAQIEVHVQGAGG
jgi:peptidyl-prolyl cis-trans isomerase D